MVIDFSADQHGLLVLFEPVLTGDFLCRSMSVDMVCLLLPPEVSLRFFICWYAPVLLILSVCVGIVGVNPLALSAAVVSELAQTHSVMLAGTVHLLYVSW